MTWKRTTPRRLLKDFRTGDLAFDSAGRLYVGRAAQQRLVEPGRDFPALQRIQNTPRFRIRHRHLRHRRLARWPVSDRRDHGCQRTPEAGALSNRSIAHRAEAPVRSLYDFEYNSPGNFVFSPDGRYLYGSSYYTGASNLFRYDFETKKMDAISNAETGLFRPVPLADGSLIAFEYTSKGFVPARVPTQAAGGRERGEVLGPGDARQISGAAELETAAAVLRSTPRI